MSVFDRLDLALLRAEVYLKRRLLKAPTGWIELARSYPDLRRTYRETVYLAALGYLVQTGRGSAVFKNEVKTAIVEAFPDAFYEAYRAGSDEVLPDDDQWLTARINAELGFVDLLFAQLRDLKGELVAPSVYVEAANRRADGYAQTLDAVFTEGRLRGARNVMLTLIGEDGETSCKTCKRLKGQRHSAGWWARRGLIPGQPGNPNYECGGHHCKHKLVDDEGKIWSMNRV